MPNIGWLWDATPYMVHDYNINTGAGTDHGPILTQAILDATTSPNNWRGIWIPPGFYKVATTIKLNPQNGVTTFEIQGAGGYPADGNLFTDSLAPSVCTGLFCTGGQAALDTEGSGRLVFRKLVFEGYATSAGTNPVPPYFIQIQHTGASGGTPLEQLVEDCSFFDGKVGITYGILGQNNCDRFRILRGAFRNLVHCFHSGNTESVLNMMEDCSCINVGSVAWIDQGGAFHAKRINMSQVGYGAQVLAGDPYWVPASHTTTSNPYGDGTNSYWAFGHGGGGNSAATMILEGLRGENGTGQYVYCSRKGWGVPPKHNIRICGLDDTASAASTAQLFRIGQAMDANAGARLNFRGGRVNVGYGTNIGTGDPSAIVMFDGTEFATMPLGTLNQPSNLVNFCRYFDGTKMTVFPSSTL